MRNAMKDSLAVLAAMGLGTGAMYLFDPETGNRRRALIRGAVARSANLTQEAIGMTWRDARNRSRGLLASVPSLLQREQVNDQVLKERVRSKLGTLVRHPSSIEVTAENGHVTLSGPVLSKEVGQLLDQVRRVKGVAAVENRLEVHAEPGNIPGLQGDPPRPPRGEPFELMQANWSPTARAGVGIVGASLALYGASRRDLAGAGIALFGVAALTRASLNLPLKRIVGLGAGCRAVDLNKTMTIAAPLERVFDFWAHYEKFPRYTAHVREVQETGEGRSRWTVVGPAGVALSSHITITSFIPNQELAWRTEPDSIVQHAGILKFMENGDGTTTIHLRMSYNPPGGAVGHGIASLLRSDPKTLIEDDLVRIKTVLESGKILVMCNSSPTRASRNPSRAKSGTT